MPDDHAIKDNRALIFSITLATFILLLGLGMTPLPGGSGGAFVSRVFNVTLVFPYTIGAVS
jgi:hypothetical protein